MASIRQTKNGYRAEVYVLGVRDSATLRTKREAQSWAAIREVELRQAASLPEGDKHTLGEAIEAYIQDVAPGFKNGGRSDAAIAKRLLKLLPIDRPIGKITSSDVKDFRDSRLKVVSSSSVLREMKVLTNVLEVARREWGWLSINPVREVRKPKSPPHRSRTLSRSEIMGMLKVLGYSPMAANYDSLDGRLALCFLLALRTGMRAGELCALTWRDVQEKKARVGAAKTDAGIREVPLSVKARRLVAKARGFSASAVIGLDAELLSSLFVRRRASAKLKGFTFHDTRHTAATWMAKKVDVLTLCKIFGWSNPKMAMIYYNPKAADIADLL